MLDGPATESMTSPVSFRPSSNSVAFEQTSPGGAFKKQEGETFFEKEIHKPLRKLEEGPNFSRLPPEILEDGKQFTPNSDEKEATKQLVAELMKHTAPSAIPAESQQLHTKTMIDSKDPTIPGEVKGSKDNKTVLWNWSTKDIDNFIKNLGDKIKTFGKNAWYYMSGSFILDKGSKPT